MGAEKPDFGAINWIELLLGDVFNISYEKLQATPLSLLNYLLKPVGQDTSRLDTHHGRGAHCVPNTNIFPNTYATTDLDIAKEIFDAIKSNCVRCVA